MRQSDNNDLILDIRDLRTSFDIEEGEVRAVDGVTLSVKRGSFMAIVGESGCGKSVTAYSIMKLIQKPGRISGGSIRFFPQGEAPITISDLREGDDLLYHLRGGLVSMVFQEPMTALSPVHTIGNQLCEAILIHQEVTVREAERQAVEMLGRVGIPGPEQRMKQYPFEMSGGMRQRVVIAMALVCRPQLLIADEPTTALDVTIQAQIMALIKELQAEMGLTVILITHDLGVVAQTAEEVAVMYLGRIVEQADVRSLLKRPRHPYTISLLQSLPSLAERHERLFSIKGTVPSLSAIPPGCPFHPRCPYSRPGTCDVGGPPELEPINEASQAWTACLLAEEIRGNDLKTNHSKEST